MAKIKNKNLSDFFSELRFTPKTQKFKQLLASIEFLNITDPQKEYPLEFICYRITDYRPKTDYSQIVIPGTQLIEDLRSIILILSNQVEMNVTDYDGKVYSTQQLADEFSVSTKTIQRWRNNGLVAWTFVFPDGKKRIGIPQSGLIQFLENNPTIMKKALGFSKLSNKDKKIILDLAAKYGPDAKTSRHQVYLRIAEETNRSIETIRCTIIAFEKANPNTRLFQKPSGTVSPKEASQLYKLYRQGAAVKELMRIFYRSRSSIHRIINIRRARSLHQMKIEYIDSKEFRADDAEENILTESLSLDSLVRGKSGYLLNRQQEIELFRRYNYLKYLACIERATINLKNPSGKVLQKIESCLDRSEQIKNMIIEANLRLVVSIAGKHQASGANLSDLISEGNISLMHAVEKFNYTRGNRFSTYASWAITTGFARKIPQETSRLDRAGTGDMLNVDQDIRNVNTVDFAAIENAHQSLEQVIKENLDEREQYIIRSHFGLDGDRITKKKKTLKEIGDTLGLTKERVRQIELTALQQLRHCLSPKEFDQLTG